MDAPSSCQTCKKEITSSSEEQTPQGGFCSPHCYLTYKKVKLLTDLHARHTITQEELLERLFSIGSYPLVEEDKTLFLREEILKELENQELKQSRNDFSKAEQEKSMKK